MAAHRARRPRACGAGAGSGCFRVQDLQLTHGTSSPQMRFAEGAQDPHRCTTINHSRFWSLTPFPTASTRQAFSSEADVLGSGGDPSAFARVNLLIILAATEAA